MKMIMIRETVDNNVLDDQLMIGDHLMPPRTPMRDNLVIEK